MNKYQIRATNVSCAGAYAIATYVLSAKAGVLFNMDIEDAGTYTISFSLEAENELPAEVANNIMTGVVQHISVATMKENRQETDETLKKEPEDESHPEDGEAPAEVVDVDYYPKNDNSFIDEVITVELPKGEETSDDMSEPVVETVVEEADADAQSKRGYSFTDEVITVELPKGEETSDDMSEPVVETVVEEADADAQSKRGYSFTDEVITVDLPHGEETSGDGTTPVDQSNVDVFMDVKEKPAKVDPFVQLNYDLEKAETVEDIILATAVYIGYDEDTTEKLRMVTHRFVSLMNAGVEVTWKNVWKKIKGIDPIAFDSKKKYIFQPLLTKPFHEIQKGAQFPTFIKSCIQKSLYWKNVQEAKTSSGVTQKEAESAEGGSESK